MNEVVDLLKRWKLDARSQVPLPRHAPARADAFTSAVQAILRQPGLADPTVALVLVMRLSIKVDQAEAPLRLRVRRSAPAVRRIASHPAARARDSKPAVL